MAWTFTPPKLQPPLKEMHVTCPHGPRVSPITGRHEDHAGVDLRAPEGTPVYAAGDGLVVRSYTSNDEELHAAGYLSYGERVVISHDHGWSTSYAHLSRRVVEKGDRVKAGDLIGYSGASGDCKGAHLDWELRRAGVPFDPMQYLK